jgi:hypothetical protein
MGNQYDASLKVHAYHTEPVAQRARKQTQQKTSLAKSHQNFHTEHHTTH